MVVAGYVDRLELVNRVMVDVLLQAIPDQSSQGAVTVNESPLLAPRLEPGFRRSHKNVGPHKISQSFNSKKALALSKSLQKQIQKTIDKFKQNLIDRQTGKISKPAMNPSGKNTLSKIILPSVVNPGYQLENYKAVQSNINTGITVTEPSSLSSSSRLTEDTVHHLDRQKNNMEDKNAHPDFERNETNSGGNFSSSGADFILRLPIKPHQTRASVKIIFGLEAKNGTSVISCSSNGSTSDTSECSLSNSTTPWIPSFFKQLFDYFAQHLNSTGTLINMFCKSGNDSTDAADDETEPSTQIHERRAQISFDIVNSSNASKMEEERNENNTPHGKAAEETIVRDLREDNLGINQNNSGFSSNVQPLTSDLIYQEITARSAGTNHSSHAFVSNYSRESLPSSPELNASCPLEERWNKVEHLRRTIELLLLSVPVSLKEIMDASSYHYLEDFIFRPQGERTFVSMDGVMFLFQELRTQTLLIFFFLRNIS